MHWPGDTLCSVTDIVGDAAFIHDTLFMPDSGTARTDFPAGDARKLWGRRQAIRALPERTRLFARHDYQPGGRPISFQSTIAQQKDRNVHLQARDVEDFVDLPFRRDRTLPMPKLILHALQVNIRGSRLPDADESGKRFLKIPLGGLGQSAW